MEDRVVKNNLLRIARASTLLAAITFGTYGVFARAQANAKVTSIPPRTPVKRSASSGGPMAVSATWNPKAPVPVAAASYSNLSDGSYKGSTEYAYYGYVKVDVTIHNGKISQVQVPTYPNDNGTSRYINSVALPYLKQETVQSQSARINLISGATFTSEAFVKSLNSALSKAASS